MKKNNTGITLVALVITIIVLIILAGVSINSVMNGGLIDNAKVAKDEFSKAADSETKDIDSLTLKTDMLVAEANSGNAGGTNENTLVANNGMITGFEKGITVAELEEMLPEGYSVLKADGNGFDETKDENGKTEKERTYVKTGIQIVKNGNVISRTVIYGDINNDGAVGGTDTGIIEAVCAGTRELEDYQKVAADIDFNGVINQEDAKLIILAASTLFNINQKAKAQDVNKIRIETDEQYYARKLEESGISAKITKKEWAYNEDNEAYCYYLYIPAGTTVGNIEPTNAAYSIIVRDNGSKLSETDPIGDGAELRTLSEDATVQGQNVKFSHSDRFYFKVNASE